MHHFESDSKTTGLRPIRFSPKEKIVNVFTEIARYAKDLDSSSSDSQKTNGDTLRKVRRSLRTISNRWSKVGAALNDLSDGCNIFELEISPPNQSDSCSDGLRITLQLKDAIKKIDSRVWAFGRATDELDYEFMVCSAEQIGYKRTKRGETERPKQLFCAFEAKNAGGGDKRILDLEFSNGEWDLVLADKSHRDDLLSTISKARIWHQASISL